MAELTPYEKYKYRIPPYDTEGVHELDTDPRYPKRDRQKDMKIARETDALLQPYDRDPVIKDFKGQGQFKQRRGRVQPISMDMSDEPSLDDALAAITDTPETLTGTQAKPSYASTLPASPVSPDDSLHEFTSQGETDQLRGTVAVGTKQDPSRSTKVLQLFGKTGLPHDFIDRNLDFVNQEAAKQDFNPEQLMKDSPAFASWLSEHPDHVAAAGADVGNLSFIEKQLRNIPAQYEQGQRTVEYGNLMLDVAKGLLDKTDVTALRKRQAELEAEMSQPDETGLAEAPGVSGVLQRAPGWMAQQLPVLGSTIEEQIKTGAKGVAVGAAGGAAVGGLPGAAAGGVAVGMASWRIGAAINSAKMEFGQAFGDYEKLKDADGNPLDQQTAMGLAGIVGVVNGSIDGFFGIEGLTSKLPGINRFSRQGIKELLRTPTTSRALLSYAKTVGQVMATEGVTEALQMYIAKAGGVALQAVKDGGSPADWVAKIFSPENLKQAATEAEAGAFGGGGIAGVMATPGLATDISKVREANKAKQAFESIGKATEGTKFAQDLPGPLKDMIARATENGPIENLYVPEHAFTEYFQKEGVDPREVYKEITGDVEAYDQATQTGADLPIKTSDYVQKLAGTKHNAFFANELRTSVDAMNGFEAAEWVKQQDEQDKLAAEQPGVKTSTVGDPTAAVGQDITGQLLALGFPPLVVDQYAALFESRYRARAERRGLGETAAQLFQQQNLSVTRPVPPVLQNLGNTTELDALLNRLRVGDVPKPEEVFGQSLTEFLKSKGGLQDQGGELATRNVDQAAKPFTKKLVQEKGLTLDEAAQRAVEAGYLEERDVSKLLDALDQEARGTPLFAIGKENTRAYDLQQNLDSLKAYLDAKGIDLKTATNAEIKKLFGEAVQQTLPTVEGQTFAQAAQWATPEFQAWFGDSKVVDENGNPLVVYHGTRRADRIGTKFSKKRATSGPMAFFTADKDIASKYATGKPDTSISLEDRPYQTWFKIKPDGMRSMVDIARAWWFLSQEERNKIAELAPRVGNTDSGVTVLHDAGHKVGLGGYDQHLKEAHGNHLAALVDEWLNSGALFNSEEEFLDVLKLAGLTRAVTYDDPHAQHPAVFPVYLSIQNPLVTSSIPTDVVNALAEKSRQQRLPKRDIGADPWDKTIRNPHEWIKELQSDLAANKNSFVWSSIPDWVTAVLKEKGYDGIQDTGGKMGGIDHDVWVPFEETQIKSAIGNRGTFSASSPNILYQAGDKPKGSITFGDNQINIKLLEKADLSTFLHESGHLYLNELITDATTPGVSPQLSTDLDTILAWMKLDVRVADGADAIKGAIKTKHHEQFARGFEAYTMEGKSPSQAMREVFATFRQWLIQAYRSLTTAPLNVNLTKAVREVMDRMIATDQEIDQAATEAEVHPLFTNAIAAGMSPTEFAAYQETVAKASLLARETLQKQLMAQYQRQQEQWWKTELDALRLEITAKVNRQPEYVALSVLQTGTMPDGSPLPTGIEPMKLDRKALAAQFGQDFLNRLPRGTMSKNGMHQDAVAPLFGFNSGQELVMAIVNARPKVNLINAEADQQMQDRHGDMRFDGTIAEAARIAVMNEHQEQVIAVEIRALNKKQREVAPFVKAVKAEVTTAQQQGRALLRTMIPTLEDTRKLARGILQRTALKQLNPFHYSVAARQASKQATAALAKDEYLDAGLFKQRELLNLALFREATIIKQQIEKTHELAKDFGKPDATLAKSRNVDLINVGRAILAQYGLARPAEKTAAEYLAPIKTYDQDLYDQWKPQVDALAPRPLDYNNLTVEEFTKLHEDLSALWLLSRRTKQMKIDQQLVDRKQIVEELSAVMAGFTDQQKSQVVGAQTPWADTKVGLLSWGSALKRVESWVRLMDGGNINGIFRRYLWTPISEASDTFRAAKKTVLQQYLELIKPIEKTLTRDLIPAPELGPNVSFRGKTALLHAILHTGNESNESKLLRGYGWEPAGWTRFLERMTRDKVLTKADYDFAQGVWDLLESIKPEAQQAHHEMYGYYFSEITARPITTPWGEYRGGYVPAIADRAKSVDQAIREEKELFDQGGNSFMFPTTGRGFTKARVEEYAAPLALDMTTIPMHLDKILRFVHLEPRVKDAARLVTNKGFRQALDAMNSTVAKDMLVPWLQRSAQQTVSTPGKNRHADALWRYLRKSVGAQIMVGNVLNTLQQFTGFPIAATMVKAKHLRGAMMSYLRHPVTYAEDIAERSAFMKGRSATQVIEIQQTIDDILLNPTKYDKVRKFLERHGYFLQQGTQNLVDLVTWGGAYDQATAQGLEETMAVRAADSAVRLTQGTFAPEDISAFESGTPFTRAFTMFYSYFNMQANLLDTEFRVIAHEMGLRKGAGRAFYVYLMGFMLPAVLSESILKGLGGFDPGDDDDYLNEALSVFFGSQLRTALAMIPGVGPITLSGIGAFTSKQYDDRISTSPIVTVLESAVRAPHSLYQAMSEEGHSKRAIRDLLTLVGLVTGLPAGALSRPLGYAGDVYDGVANPETAGDVARGLVSGKDVNRTK